MNNMKNKKIFITPLLAVLLGISIFINILFIAVSLVYSLTPFLDFLAIKISGPRYCTYFEGINPRMMTGDGAKQFCTIIRAAVR